VIEKDGAKVERLSQELGDVAYKGDGCEAATMEATGFGRADMVIAVTGDDEDNLVSCQVAKTKFGVPRTIARINNPKNEAIFRKLGIDTTVSATGAILSQIEQELPEHPLMRLLTFKGGGLEIVEVRVPGGASVVGKRIRDLLLPQHSIIVLLVGLDSQPRVPTSETVILADDEVLAVTRTENEDALRRVLTMPAGDAPAPGDPGYGRSHAGPYEPTR
jgi:trk system potassium uptake protein TrkA